MPYLKSAASAIVTILLISCTSNESPKNSSPELVQIDSLEIFMDFENHGIVQPGDLAVMDNGNVVVADGNIMKITIVDSDGNLVTQFGKEGKGPAEFIRPSQILLTSNKINVVDVSQKKVLEFDFDGNFMDTYLYESSGFVDNIALMDERRYFAEAGGVDNKLIKFTDVTIDSTLLFGEAKGGVVESVDFEKSKNDIQNGRVPAFLRNMTNLVVNDDHLYAFLDSYSELRKYDFKGNLIWDKPIALPDNELLLEQVIESSKRAKNGVPLLRYTIDVKLVNDQIYLLGSKVYEQPQHLTVVNETGEIETIYEFTNPEFTFSSFNISPANNTIHLSSRSDGFVYRTQL